VGGVDVTENEIKVGVVNKNIPNEGDIKVRLMVTN
jgi:hypothetical protein